MTRHFLLALDELNKDVLAMGGAVEATVSRAVRAFLDRDVREARAVVDGDRDINLQELRIDEECLKILALHQPTARDLRFVTGVMKIINDLERVADLSVNVAERAVVLAELPPRETPGAFVEMADRARAHAHRLARRPRPPRPRQGHGGPPDGRAHRRPAQGDVRRARGRHGRATPRASAPTSRSSPPPRTSSASPTTPPTSPKTSSTWSKATSSATGTDGVSAVADDGAFDGAPATVRGHASRGPRARSGPGSPSSSSLEDSSSSGCLVDVSKGHALLDSRLRGP